MRTKSSRFLTLLLAFLVQITFAQEKTITGNVTDHDGLPLPGANVVVKGTANGTQTNFDGNYSINASVGQTLVYSFIGQQSEEKTVGNSNFINVQLLQDTQTLDEIVVTALGISREKKSLGYATQEVGGDELTTVKSGNFTNALSGKASGIQVKKTTNMGGSTNVLIRGNTSLTGDNQALFVIDGVPISNRNTNSRSQEQGGGNGYDYGNAASDINPEDIESINILKGAAASALYGSRAANGVIMITTKKGGKTEGFGVTLNSGFTFGAIDKSTFIKYQDQYGAGYGPYYDDPSGNFYYEDIDGDGSPDLVAGLGEDASYGAAFDPNLLVYQWDAFDPANGNFGQRTPWVNGKNGPITFFETPTTFTNSISLDKGFESGSMRLNYTHFDQSGLMPNSELKKHNFSMSGNYEINDKLSVTGFANYIKTNGLGRNSTGYGDNLVGGFRQWWQTNVDIQQQRDIYFQTGRNVTWNPTYVDDLTPIYWDNPYWTRYENYQNDERNRFIGNISLTYELTDWLNVTGRIATDTYSEIQEERRAVGSVPSTFGIGTGGGDGSIGRNTVGSGYSRKDITATETNYDLMLNFNKNLSESFNVSGILGANIRRNEFNSILSATNGGISVPGLYSLQNSAGPLPLPKEVASKIGVDGVYGSLSLGYNNLIYLDGTIRRDHSSTLPKDNSVFYYPSVATSFVFSNLIDGSWLSFGKLRANYAEVGNSAPFDYLLDSFNVNTPIGSASTSVGNTKKNPDLKPETTTSIEAGLEMTFVERRLGFDLAYYKTNSKDQILPVRVSEATGFLYKIINAGEIENKGIELSVFGTPIKTRDFNWNINVNWTKNENKVVSLTEGLQTLQLGSFQGGVTINAEVGQPYGVIYGTDYTYLNPDNPIDSERLIDESTGEYIKTSTSDNIIGDSNPDWLMGISNKFNYKSLSFSFLIDIQKGGTIWSLDQYYGLATGLPAETAFINDLGNPVRNSLADGGGFVNVGSNPDGSVNTTRIRADRFGAFGYRRGLPDKAFAYDASYVKLREIAISYNLPKELLSNTFINEITFSVVGSNLWIIDKNLPHADPESGLGSGNLQGYSVGSLPSTKDYGFNLKLKF